MTTESGIHARLGAHSPWTDSEHDEAVARTTARAEARNRIHRRTADLGFFATAAFAGLLFLSRDGVAQMAVIALAGAAALSLVIALRAGSSVRSVGCLVEEWKAEVGTHPLADAELLLLRSHARAHPAAQAALERWVATGLPLRQRDFDALVGSLRETGMDVPQRDRAIDVVRWAEAL